MLQIGGTINIVAYCGLGASAGDFKKYKTKTLNMSISISLSSSVEKHSRTFI